jgi:hypothetical protein
LCDISWRPSDYEHIYEFVDGFTPSLRKAAGEVSCEFRFEQGNAFVTATVTEGIF